MVTEHSVSLKIEFDDDVTKFYPCTGEHESGKGFIAKAYSYKHAISLGWRFTDHIRFAPPGTTVAVCPECAKIALS